MYIQPLQAIESPGCYHVGGDVTIHPSATIAPGALIRAEPNCKIEIGSAACVGMGVVLHACEGNIKIGPGASLGAAVLIVGHASVGSNASVGSSTTIRNCDIDSSAIVPAASLLGEMGKPEAETIASTSNGSGLLGDIDSTAVCNTDGSADQPTAVDFHASERDVNTSAESNGFQRAELAQASSNESADLPVNGDLPTIDSNFGTAGGYQTTPEEWQNPSHAIPRPLVSGPPVANGQTGTQDEPVATSEGGDSFNNKPSDVSRNLSNTEFSNGQLQESHRSEPAPASHSLSDANSSLLAPKPLTPKPSPAFGKSQVNRLMKSLFPHSRAHSEDSSNGFAALPDAGSDAGTVEGVTSDSKI